ncbi:trypsin-like serine protease [Myxococcota bacterium]|nr:trypsin-like serine protease [Myxococcota bacterium]MBU1410701.1 trypsin-like serine protease [Myxococcota bacterium]MBU1509551.1 trypsin-like serine protease [Myxococcota bacterium]
MRKLLLSAVLFVMAFGCGSENPPSLESFIINGSVDTSAANDAVAFLYLDAGYACGGTLIAPNVLMTAGHCVTYSNTTTPVPVDQFSVFFCRDLNNCDMATRSREVIQSWVHPSYNATNIRYDIALLRLSGPAPGDVTPIPILPAAQVLTNADIGAAITFVGYGLTNGSDENSNSMVRRIYTGSIEGLCHSSNPCTISQWSGTYAAPWTIWTDQNNGGTCQGDSGGPGLVTRNNVKYVAGITSYGYSECTGPGVYTEVSNYESQINTFINGAPAEICTDSIDNDGDGAVDCADSTCTGVGTCPSSPCEDYYYLFCNETVNSTTKNGIAGFTEYACMAQGTETGPEIAFQLAMPPGTVVQITMTPLDQDLDIFLLSGDRYSCASSSCLQYSANDALAAETMSVTVGETPTYLVVESYRYPGRFSLTTTCVFPPENCTNSIDDDGDDDTDCDDTDCASQQVCQAPTQEYWCDDDIDNDQDGLTDCADSDCASNAACAGQVELACADQLDNDGDGWADCFDPDCANSVACKKKEASDSGCSTSARPRSGGGWMLLLAFIPVIIRRRRRK